MRYRSREVGEHVESWRKCSGYCNTSYETCFARRERVKLWVLDKQGNCLFNYKDSADNEVCEHCLSSVPEEKCARARYSIHKTTELNQFRFCFDKHMPGKQARFNAKLIMRGYSDVFRVTNALQEDIRSL